MKIRLKTAFFLIAVLSTPVHAQTDIPLVPEAAAPSEVSPTPVVEPPHVDHYGMSLGAGSAISKFHYGLGITAQVPIVLGTLPLKIGAETGFYYGPSAPRTYIIPILVTVAYAFNSISAFSPTIAFAVGMDIGHASNDLGSITGEDPAVLLVLGTGIGQNKKFFVEVPLGLISSDFAVLPRIGMYF